MKLKQRIQERRKTATEKAEIDFLASLSAQADAEASDREKLRKKNEELASSYKEVVRHSAFPPKDDKETDKPTEGAPLSGTELLQSIINKQLNHEGGK